MEKPTISEEQQNELLKELSRVAGWKILDWRIKNQLELIGKKLEGCKEEELTVLQGQVQSLRYVLRQVEGSVKNARKEK